MAPEYGATCGLFPIDAETINYLKFTGRDPERVALVEAYAKAQGMWRDENTPDPVFTDALTLDLSTVEPRWRARAVRRTASRWAKSRRDSKKNLHSFKVTPRRAAKPSPSPEAMTSLRHGDVVIAAITSCTNTSNPSVLIAAGLVARKALEKGLKVKPWVKTSLAPGSRSSPIISHKSGLQRDLDALGFNIVGYGCTTCIGNSGPLPEAVANAVVEGDLVAAAVLSGNRNFEGRVNPHCKANYLASPPLVVAYALAGSMTIDLTTQPIGTDSKRRAVYLKDIWPKNKEIQDTMRGVADARHVPPALRQCVRRRRAWQEITIAEGMTYKWEDEIDLRQIAADIPKHAGDAGAGARRAWREIVGAARQFDHHRSYFARRRH